MNKNINKFWCDPAKVLKTLIGAFLGIGLVVYVWLQATQDLDSDIETETAVLVTVNDTVQSRAYIFRDETVVGKTNSGTIVTVVSEGDRVSKGQLLANIYPNSEDAHLQDEINRIDRKLEILEESTVDSQYVITDLSKIDGEITDLFEDIYFSSASGKISKAIDASAELLAMLNKRDLIVNSSNDYSTEKKQLTEQRRMLEAQIDSSSKAVYAEGAGYFYSDVDGYEEIFTPDKIDELTLESFEKLTRIEPDEDNLSMGAVKIINDFVWNVVCEISADKLALLNENQSYKIVFSESGDEEITMKLIKKISESTSPTALAVFRANVMPSTFNFKRGQKANVVLGEKQGLAVPKKAVRYINGESGVYILVGDVIHYRRINIVEEKENYYLVSYEKNEDAFVNVNEESDTKMLSLYDNVIVSGKELFDGKIVG